MPLFSQFCAGAYTMRSAVLDTEACINLFFESVDSGANAKKTVLYGTPGLIPLVVTVDTSCRGMFSQDGRTLTVIGATLYDLTFSGSGVTIQCVTTNRGTLANDGKPVFFASNGKGGNQLAIQSAGNLYIFNLSTNTLTGPISLPLTNSAGALIYLNGYFLLAEVNTPKVWFSQLEDGTSWDALDFFTRSNTSDYVVGMVALHDQIKVFGSKTSELYYNVGEADNPFLPYPGSISMDGAIAATGCGVLGEQIFWLSKNEWDVVRVMSAGVGESKIISTPAIEFALAGYSTVADVEILTYEQEGHPFVAFTFPTDDVTWVYDAREGFWHQRGRWNSADDTMHRWRVRGVCAPGSQAIICGDYLTGNIYELSMDRFDDNCARIKRVRRAPYPSSENQWLFLDEVELGLQSSVQSTAVPNPQVNLRISRDYGVTYTASLPTAIPTTGPMANRPIWRRCGRVREDMLVLEVSQTDAVRTVWGPGIWLRQTQGSGQL